MKIRNHAEMRQLFNSAGRARKIKGARVFSTYMYAICNPDNSYSIGTISGGYGEHPYQFNSVLNIGTDNILRAQNVHPDFRILDYFGLKAGRAKTVKRRGIEFRDAWKKDAESFWQSESIEFDMVNRVSLNPDNTELKWDKAKAKEFNLWMKELKLQFYARAKLGILITPETAPHFYANDRGRGHYRFWTWGRKKLDDPMGVFEAIKFDKPEELIPFTEKMCGLLTAGGVTEAFPYERQTAEIDRVFASNRHRLQEQYGARQYE